MNQSYGVVRLLLFRKINDGKRKASWGIGPARKPPPPPAWIGAQNRAQAAFDFVALVNDVEKGEWYTRFVVAMGTQTSPNCDDQRARITQTLRVISR